MRSPDARRSVFLFGVLVALSATFSDAQEKKIPESSRGEPRATLEKPRVHRAGELLGRAIRGSAGETLGKIEELAVTEGGVVAYAIMSFGGVLGIGHKLVAVPWHLLKFDAKEKAFSVPFTRADIEKAPSVEMGKLPMAPPPLGPSPAGTGDEEGAGQGSERKSKAEGASPGDQTRPHAGPSALQTPRPDGAKQGDALFLLVSAPRESEERLTNAEGGPLALVLRPGNRFAFQAAAPDDRRGSGGWYGLTVQEVTPGGEATLLLSIQDGTPSAAGSSGERGGGDAKEGKEGEGAKSPKAATTITLKLGTDGVVKGGAKAASIPREMEPHLRFIFGSGVHREALEPGKVLALAPLRDDVKAESDPKSDLRLRFEEMKEVGGEKLARFSVVVRGDTTAPPPPPPRGARPGPGAPGAQDDREPPGARGAKAGENAEPEWRAVGEATYRMEDGLLEKLHVTGLWSPKLLPGTSIRRIESKA